MSFIKNLVYFNQVKFSCFLLKKFYKNVFTIYFVLFFSLAEYFVVIKIHGTYLIHSLVNIGNGVKQTTQN